MLLTGGCVTTGAGDGGDAGGPRRDIAARPESLPPEPPATGRPTRPSGPSAASSSGRPSAGTSGSAPGSAPAATPGAGSAPPGATTGPGSGPAAPFRTVGSARDGRRDAGGSTPGYADLVAVTVEDDGTSARVTVTMDADLPARLPEDETMGVGVDFFRTAAQVESDYQLFADGEPDGWYAYLQGPDGFVRYPGRFGLGGRRLVFTVPWSALGGPRSGRFSAFADWTRAAMPANLAGEDHAPNLGTAAFTR